MRINDCYGGNTRRSGFGREAPVDQKVAGTSLLPVCVQQRLARSRRAQSTAGTDLKEVRPETVRTWPERERSGRAPGAIGRLG